MKKDKHTLTPINRTRKFIQNNLKKKTLTQKGMVKLYFFVCARKGVVEHT